MGRELALGSDRTVNSGDQASGQNARPFSLIRRAEISFNPESKPTAQFAVVLIPSIFVSFPFLVSLRGKHRKPECSGNKHRPGALCGSCISVTCLGRCGLLEETWAEG